MIARKANANLFAGEHDRYFIKLGLRNQPHPKNGFGWVQARSNQINFQMALATGLRQPSVSARRLYLSIRDGARIK
jgi:hypothetical protein